MHHIDQSTPWEEIWQAMEQLAREVKLLYVGSSGFAGLVSEQSLYALSARTIELGVMPSLRAQRSRPDPVEPTWRRFARQCLEEGQRGPEGIGGGATSR